MSKRRAKNPRQEAPTQGFLKIVRGDKARELMAYPNAWTLLSVVAYRARRTNTTLNPHGLQLGEALIGDYRSYGMTCRNYRTAKQQLEKWDLATFKATNKGTIAKLADTSVYDININGSDKQADTRPTSSRQAADKQADTRPTTNEENEDEKNLRNERSEERRLREKERLFAAAPVPDSRTNHQETSVSSVSACADSSSARFDSPSARLGLAIDLRKLLKAKSQSDLKALWNFGHWLDGQNIKMYSQALEIAKASGTGRKPIALFFSRVSDELGYRPRAIRDKQK